MKAAMLICAGTMLLAACNKGPEVHEENASVAEVANKVAEAGGASQFVRPGRWESTVTIEEIPYLLATVQFANGCRLVGAITGTDRIAPDAVVDGVFIDHESWTELRFRPRTAK